MKTRLASLFNVDISVIEKVFRNAPTIIHRHLDEDKARKYKETVEKNGALCRIEKEIPSTPPPPPPPSTPVPGQNPSSPPPGISQSQSTLYSPPPHTTSFTEVNGPRINIEEGVQHLDRKAWQSLGIGFLTAV